MKKLLAMLLVIAMLTLSCATAEEVVRSTLIQPYMDGVETWEKETLTLYFLSAQQTKDVNVLFVNGEKGIPYVSAETITELLTILYRDGFGSQDFSIGVIDEGESVTLMRENDSALVLDAEENAIAVSNFDLFCRTPDAANALDMVQINAVDGEPYLISHETLVSRMSGTSLFYLDKYGIEILSIEGELYLPLQTFSDLIFSQSCATLAYNGKAIFVATSSSFADKEYSALYSDVEYTTKSESMIQFTYNELCLALDTNYGLAEQHNIDSFDQFFVDTGLAAQLLSEDPGDTYSAVYSMITNHLADKHSAAVKRSPLGSPQETEEMMVDVNEYFRINSFSFFSRNGRYAQARAAAYPDGVKGYEEVGNTAFVTFDAFVVDASVDLYSADAVIENTTADTLQLLVYANRQIHREDSPIENVVIDLTNNSGGMIEAAVSVVAWFLGQCQMNLTDVKNNTSATTVYRFDADLDRTFDEAADSVSSLRLFCLIGPRSFSCGNLVPYAFKSSDRVTLIGRTTDGGTCTVLTLSTADGSLFCCSSRYQVSTLHNGIYSDVDAGVAPDIYVTDIEKLYDRQWIVDLINE